MPAAHACVCSLLQRRVQDVISPIVFEAAYSLGQHVSGEEERELPALTPVLRWKKGQKIAQKNQVRTLKPTTGTPGGRSMWQESRPWLPGGPDLPLLICKKMKCMIWGVASRNHVVETH